ncbi:hypothetical protein, partial [Pseudomonas aeruginosa]|uniref:hypothetical protein n=1 Tax=Pseudomonas aeruginosa TaxID=287 RepID=UPI0031B6F92C
HRLADLGGGADDCSPNACVLIEDIMLGGPKHDCRITLWTVDFQVKQDCKSQRVAVIVSRVPLSPSSSLCQDYRDSRAGEGSVRV